jgi:drug/metabolite transporter (DMT)-like permease
MNFTAVAYALLAAALFGVSTPAAKMLLGAIDPVVLAGLLYCGAGLGAAALRRLPMRASNAPQAPEQPLGRSDVPWLAGAILSGGIVGPLLLMAGLSRSHATTASLLLTFEGVATALMAWFIFKEPVNRRIALGMICLVAGAIVLAWTGAPSLGGLLGPLAIIGACVAWALDNNLTRKVSLADPLQIVELKGLIAGPANLALGLWAGASLPPAGATIAAAVVGVFGYGVSLALFIVALRHVGAARTAAYFSTAPFIGAVAAVIGLGEPLSLQLVVAGLLMGLGVWLHLSERHEHRHTHDLLTHAHPHVHDQHHRHRHSPDTPPGEPHTHVHTHGRLDHAHPHAPDMHHLHRH